MPNPLHDALLAPHAGRETAFLHLPGGGDLTHAAFLDRAARMAGALAGRGLAPGDRLAATVEKSADALALYAACLQAGLVFLPLNPGYTDAELAYFVENSAAAALVVTPKRAAALAPLAERCGARLLTLGTDRDGALAEAAAAAPPMHGAADRRPDDLAALLYTSGTTGRPKGAMMSHENLLSNARTLVDMWGFTAGDVLLHALPIFHTHGLFVASNVMLAAGGAMIFLPGFEIDALFAHLPRATAMMGVPTFYTRLLDDPRLGRDTTAHMRLFISGSAPLLDDTHRAFVDRTGHRILERYGMTETNMIASNPLHGERRAGTVGRPLPGVSVRVADPETGAALPPGETGSVEVRGPNVFRGYWGMPEKTAEDMRPDGYFVTGDLGGWDAEGYLRLVGRAKDLIISGGYNVYPKEVEALLDAQPGVVESAVIGVPHPDFGETPVAVLAADPGAAPDPEALDAALAAALARYKHPRRYIVVEALPRNAMGKVQKAALRRAHAGLFTGAAAARG